MTFDLSSTLKSKLSPVARMGWEIVPLPEAVFFQEGPGIRNWQYVEQGIPFVNIRCLVDGRLDVSAMSQISPEEVDRKYRHFLLDEGDYVVSSSGTIGRLAEVRSEDLPCMLNTSVIRMRPLNSSLDRRFLKQFLLSSLFQEQIEMWAAGSAQVNYGPTHLKQMFIVLPPLPQQRAIAHILGTLDDKIELNRRMSQTLEEIARAIFTSWFIDFDPVRAKAAGRQPAGMDAESAGLFPSEFEDSELGATPFGWSWSKLGTEFEITMGQSPPGSTYNEDAIGIPFFQGRADFGSRFPGRRVFCTAPTRLAQRRDTLVSVRAPVGDINVAPEDCAIGRGLAAVRHRSGNALYTYEVLNHLQPFLRQFDSEGTVFGAINKRGLHDLTVIAPCDQVVNRFEALVEPLGRLIEHNEFESRTLSALRNTLLPKLLSGELRVAGCEELV